MNRLDMDGLDGSLAAAAARRRIRPGDAEPARPKTLVLDASAPTTEPVQGTQPETYGPAGAPSRPRGSRAGQLITPPLGVSEPARQSHTQTYPATVPDISQDRAQAEATPADHRVAPPRGLPGAGLAVSFIAGVVCGAALVHLWSPGPGGRDGPASLSTSTPVAIADPVPEAAPERTPPGSPRSRDGRDSGAQSRPTPGPQRTPPGPSTPPLAPATGVPAGLGTGQKAAGTQTQHRPAAQATAAPRQEPVFAPRPSEGAGRSPGASGLQQPYPGAQMQSQADTRPRAVETETVADKATSTWTIPFAFNRLEPSPDVLRAIRAELERCTGTVVVTGHTCNLGGAEANLAVGLARADSVRRGLVRLGIDARRLEVRSAGADRPIASNATREGRRANRRVVIDCSHGSASEPGNTQ